MQGRGTAGANTSTSRTHRLAQPGGNPDHLLQVAREDWSQFPDVTIFCRITRSLCRPLLLLSVPGTKLFDFKGCLFLYRCRWRLYRWRRVLEASKVICVPFPKHSSQMLLAHLRTKLFKKAHPQCPVAVFVAPHPVGKAIVGSNVSRTLTDIKC